MSLTHGTVLAATDNQPPAREAQHHHGSRHSSGLVLLCVIEACERFAATSLGSMMVLYMTKVRGASPSEALRTIGNFNAFCYLAPIVGGALVDRFLRGWRATLAGSILLAAAYGVLGGGLPLSLVSVFMLLVSGHGLFKPSILAMLGRLYHPGDHRREPAHSWFYFAANVGSMLAPLATGVMYVRYGCNAVFSMAAYSMVAGVFAMVGGIRLLPGGDASLALDGMIHPPTPIPGTGRKSGAARFLAVGATVIISGVALGQCDGVLLLWVRDDIQRGFIGSKIPVSWFSAMPALLVLTIGP